MDMTRRTATTPARSADPTVLRAREPGDILGAIPYLLGFHPTDSLVAAFVRDRRVVVTARVDLAATADLEALFDQLEVVAQRVGTRAMVLVGYGDDDGLRELMRDLADVIPMDLIDVLAVSGDRWWSVCCDGPCCPPDGRSYDIASHPLAAAAVMAGIPATSSRQEIVDLTAGPGLADRERLTGLADDQADRVAGMSQRRRRRRMKQIVRGALVAGGPTETEAIEMAVLARDVMVRDEAWAMMSRARGDEHVALWRRVVSVAVWPYEAAPLGMLAIAGWVSGNGALLNCCIDRLEEVAPDYSLLELCKDISRLAIAPSSFDAIAADMRAALG